MLQVLGHYRGGSYQLHAFVIMPDHFHLIISPHKSLERAVQHVKGGFSYRAARASGWKHKIWQVGFSDHRIRDLNDWNRHITYIRQNPVKAGLCSAWEAYRYLQVDLDPIPQRLKPPTSIQFDGGAQAPPLKFEAGSLPLIG
jgi:putative transposase